MQKSQQRPQFEFVAIMASLMSIVALAIDALLPAMSTIGIDINSLDPTENQKFITMIFLGLGVGQLVFGPLSDSFGRKPIVYIGFIVFCVASVICVLAPNLEWMILGRILQGIGLSAPRTISISMIRDSYKGDYMAKIMSFVTAFFILVPIVAPAMGKFVLDHYDWKGIFYIQVLISISVAIWFSIRQKETLTIKNKIAFTTTRVVNGFRETVKHVQTMGYTCISGFVVGSFLVYLSSSQQIFEVQYNLKESFPYIFAGLAGSIGTAIFLNGTFVIRFGMKKMVTWSLIGFFSVSVLYLILFHNNPHPPIYVLVGFFAMQFFCIGFLFGNLRALAMVPVGHIAGIAAAVTGFISTLMAVPISTFIGRFVEHSTLPLFVGFSVSSGLSLLILLYINRKTT